ncbi:MAG: F0F1 ATP synthase subunit A [Planctomycetaceae bacterium]
MADGHSDDVFHHVRDADYFDLPGERFDVHLPEISFLPSPGALVERISLWMNDDIRFSSIFSDEVMGLQLTKFMVLQAVTCLLVAFIAVGLSRHVRDGRPARGRFWNFWETIALFLRDEVVRPAIGTGHDAHAADHGHHDHGERIEGFEDPINYEAEAHGHVHNDIDHTRYPGPTKGQIHAVHHPADRYLPFVWTLFFYVLICNLLGAVPWLGSATGHLSVTAMLALCSFGYVIVSGSREQGPVQYWKSLVPGMDVPGPMKYLIVPMIWFIELAALFIKHCVLAVRLFANMLGGHTVLAVILGFIATSALAEADWLWYAVTPASLVGQVFVLLLELLVAFIQAYVFALLTALFIGAAIHPH